VYLIRFFLLTIYREEVMKSVILQNEEMVKLTIIRQLKGKRLWVDENGNDWHIEDVRITQLHQEDELIACINKRTPVYDLGDATILTHDDINAYGIEEGYVLELEHKGDIIEEPGFVLIYNPETCRADIYRVGDATILTHDDINAYGIEEGYVLEREHKGEPIEDPSLVLIYNPETCRADIYRVDEAAPENWLPITFFFMS
jgi:hypothetical protein